MGVISIVISCWNEEAAIGETLRRRAPSATTRKHGLGTDLRGR
jgi:hypothetical protein